MNKKKKKKSGIDFLDGSSLWCDFLCGDVHTCLFHHNSRISSGRVGVCSLVSVRKIKQNTFSALI